MEFKIDGLAEFQEKVKLVEKKAPDRILKELDKQGRKLKKAAVANTPVGKGTKRKISKSYKLLKTERVGSGFEKGITNKSPHYHLVERGHNIVRKKGQPPVGYVPGKFFFEKTIQEMEQPMNRDLRAWLDELYKELK